MHKTVGMQGKEKSRLEENVHNMSTQSLCVNPK